MNSRGSFGVGSRGQGKPTKVPYQVVNPGRHASTTDPATWSTFDAAADALDYADGMGVVLTIDAGITCIDLDGVIDERGQIDVRAQTIIDRCASFTEMSPSGTGIHVFVLGRVLRALKGAQLEIYSDSRYIAVTGRLWPGTPTGLKDQQAYLDHLARLDDRDRIQRPAYPGRSTPSPDDLAGALLAKLERWDVRVAQLKPWLGGYLVELARCPWADEHTTGAGGAAVMIHASGAFDFTCLHAHCGGRDWRAFRAEMEGRA